MPNQFNLIRKNIEKQIVINDDEFKIFSSFLIEKKISKKIALARFFELFEHCVYYSSKKKKKQKKRKMNS
jgi:hypothetical protein